MYVYSPESTKLSIKAKVFADSMPEPLLLQAAVCIEVKQNDIQLTDVLPDWKKLLSEIEAPKTKSVSVVRKVRRRL